MALIIITVEGDPKFKFPTPDPELAERVVASLKSNGFRPNVEEEAS